MSKNIDEILRIKSLLKMCNLKDQKIEVIKYTEIYSDVILHLDFNTFPIKITTDFNKYCLAESVLEEYDLNKFNLAMILKKKNSDNIVEEMIKISNKNIKEEKKEILDPFHIYQKISENSKIEINYIKLEQTFNKLIGGNSKIGTFSDKIPRDLLLSPNQISNLLLNEYKKVNRNRDYSHYIIPDDTNPYSILLRLKFDKNNEMGNIFREINKKYGYDYMELKLIFDSKAYPYIPPKIEYIKPKIKLSLLLSLLNLEILKLENWNPIINLEYLIYNLGNKLEEIGKDYIISDSPLNANSSISFNDIEYELIKLASLTKEISMDEVKININLPKISNTSLESTNNYWKSGTGYGSEGVKNWDIKNYIKEQELQKEEITKCLKKINNLINDSSMNYINDSILMKYLISEINGVSILDMDKNRELYNEIFNILSTLVGKQTNQIFINQISIGCKRIHDELDVLFKSSNEFYNDEIILYIWNICDYYIGRYKEPIKELIISTDNKENYCNIMKKLQFGKYDLPNSHRFIKNKGIKTEQKALIRILSEISSFKSGLPLNWESSIWVRVPKENLNLFSFMISGPKDTPYENGLFEFHAYLPSDYPNGVPNVLLHTTGNGKVRFNPNLYDSGKVCLSLLGTWQGQEGEKWNPKTSTFLQVMISIQSLILVEQPYFNEPGYEREMKTPSGKTKSDDYNEERQPSTIEYAMIEMIKNPPQGFEDIVINHFKLKKEEIINRTLIWLQNSGKYKNLIEKQRNELINILSTI